MKYKSVTKDEILSLRLPAGWKTALREIAQQENKSLNQMLFDEIDSRFRYSINPILNKNRPIIIYESIEDMP